MMTHPARLLLAVAALLLGMSFGSSASQAAGPYTLPAVSYITASEPATFFSPETHLVCLARSELAGAAVTTSLLCYGAEKPAPAPPPPPPPYIPSRELLLTGSFDDSTGVLLLVVLDCTEIFPGFAFSAALGIQLDKAGGGSGSIVFTTDTIGPNYTCDDGEVVTGPLTMAPLALDHDEDGDGCSDWDELDPAASGSDPFNPNDCVPLADATCTDVWLAELQQPVANQKPVAPGDPPTFGTAMAIATTYGQYDETDNTMHSVRSTYNGGIGGVIAGNLGFPITQRCATVDKAVTTSIKDNPANPTDPVTLSVNEVAGNEPMVGMIVYWDSTNANQRGFYHVDAAAGTGSVTLTRIVDGACNGEPGSHPAAPGSLRTCIPTAKGLMAIGPAPDPACETACDPKGGIAYPLAYSNTNIVDTAAISTFGTTGGVPRTDADQCPSLDPTTPKDGSCYNKALAQSESSGCGGSTGSQEGASQNAWTRTDIITVTKSVDSEKVPSYGIAQLYNPTTAKTCANVPGTLRSTNITVVWSLDSGDDTGTYDSDWDGDGCLDWQELSSPLPVYVDAPPYTNVDAAIGGRDPMNPNDCDRNMGGIWSAELTIDPVSLNGGNVRVPGSYQHCRLAITHNKTNDQLDAKVLCYVDDPNVLVNTDEADGAACPNTTWCGDGFTGSSFPIGTAAPPPPYADISTTAHAALSGSLNKTNDTWDLEGCIPDTRTIQTGGKSNTYIRITNIGGRTGNGTVEVWTGLGSCAKPGGSPDETGKANFVQHAPKDDGNPATRHDAGNYDFDLDGCPDARELTDSVSTSGLRDPSNPWDRQDFNKDGFVNIPDDLLPTSAEFGPVGNNHPADRGPRMFGTNDWNKRKWDNFVNIPDDILGTASQFGHNCF